MVTSADSTDEAKLAHFTEELATGIEKSLGPWVRRVISAHLPDAASADLREAIEALIDSEVGPVVSRVRDLLLTDIDEQRSSPLATIRQLVAPITEFLSGCGAVPRSRDADAVRLHPGDHFDIAPASFADLSPELHLPGLSWGAAKAHVHLQRRRAEGLR